MKASQLRRIIEDLKFQGIRARAIDTWENCLKSCADDTTVTPRYVGITTAPCSPWFRTQKGTQRPNSLMGAFIDTIRHHFPQLLGSSTIFTIVNTYCPDISLFNPSRSHLAARAFHLVRCY